MNRLIYATLLGFVAACGTDVGTPGTGEEPEPGVTWYQDVSPILATHCMGCHQAGGIAPFSMTDYEDAAPLASELVDAVESGIMPPFSAATTSDCAPTHGWKDDPRLSAAELATLKQWIADGRQKGEPVAIAIPAPPDLAAKTHSLTPQPYVTSGDVDQFVCFLLDPQTTTDTWLTGWQIRPGNATVVHHAVVSTLPANLMAAAKTQIGVGNHFDCSAAAAVPGASIVGAWAPGGQPFDSGQIGTKLAAGTGLIMQIHYHPGGVTADPDATTVDLRLQATPPAAEYSLLGFGNVHSAPGLQPGPYDPPEGPKFEIPANVADGKEVMTQTLPDTAPTMRVMTAFPHMHYVGIGFSAWVHRARPAPGELKDECIVNVNRWNFDWQRQYAVDAPLAQLPAVRANDTIELRCTYDNTMANPFVQRALAEQNLNAPQTIHLGEQTLDEMCISLFAVVKE